MAREILDRKINHLLDEVLVLESMVEDATKAAVQALAHRDTDSAKRVYIGDKKINAKRFELETDCMITIATQQPIMAGDLRLLASILEITGELERMGDYAKGIAKVCIKLGDQPSIKPIVDIPTMLNIVIDMLHSAINAFVRMDSEKASLIPKEDDKVDDLYNKVYRDLVEIMISDPTTVDRANLLMWVAHNLERMADRVTNICERTIYAATGEMKELEPSDDELIVKDL